MILPQVHLRNELSNKTFQEKKEAVCVYKVA